MNDIEDVASSYTLRNMRVQRRIRLCAHRDPHTEVTVQQPMSCAGRALPLLAKLCVLQYASNFQSLGVSASDMFEDVCAIRAFES